MLKTPIALCIFNRPDLTRQVIEAIGAAAPQRLFVFADGPRSPEEAVVCEEAIAATRDLPWECEVEYDISPVNLGSRYRVTSGLDWVFSQVDEAIYLEDDLGPDPSFFRFCEELLEVYRDDPRVMSISGTNYLREWKPEVQSYHFSYLANAPGWASWKRAWDTHDITMAAWGDDAVKARIRTMFANDEVYEFQAPRWDRHYADPERRYGWDPGWMLARLVHGGMTVVPSVNLITNRGNVDGRGLPPGHPIARLPVRRMAFPLRPPPEVAVDFEYEDRHVHVIRDWWIEEAARKEAAARAAVPLWKRAARKVRRAPGRLRRGR